MMGRISAAYQVELAKALRMKSTYLGFLLIALAVLAAPLLHHLERDGESDYAFLALVTPATMNLLGVLLLLAFCATLVSSEAGGGTLRLVMVRPILRHEFLLAKLLLGMTYAVILAVVVALLSWSMVLAFGDAVGVSFGGELLYTGAQVLGVYLLGTLLGLFPLFAAVAYALMISTMTRSTAASITGAIGLWIVVDAVKYPLGIAPYLFTTYLEMPWEPFRDTVDRGMDPQWFPQAWHCLGVSAASIVAFTLAAILIFRRRSLV